MEGTMLGILLFLVSTPTAIAGFLTHNEMIFQAGFIMCIVSYLINSPSLPFVETILVFLANNFIFHDWRLSILAVIVPNMLWITLLTIPALAALPFLGRRPLPPSSSEPPTSAAPPDIG